MKVLIACEFSGTVRDQFLKLGHDAWSCDLLPTDSKGPHIQKDVLEILDQGWDLMIAHPPCTYLSSSGLHWNKRTPGRAELTEKALEFVQRLMDAPIPKKAIENPVGCISSRIRKWDQIIQPYFFGDDASKETCLWLENLNPLQATQFKEGRVVLHNGRLVMRWANQTDSGQNKLGPSDDRWAQRSVTYKGIAEAMANQWGI